ncbi:MAG: hypothetical protein ACLPT4_03990 [Verrucomicrobiia bacterium]
MKRLVSIVLLVVLTLGCHTTPSKKDEEKTKAKQLQLDETRRRLHYIEANPDLSAAVKKAIAHGDVLLGMTESDVRASIGEPDEISSTETNPGAHEQWYYKTGSPGREYLSFDDGVLTSWRSAH